MLVRIIRWLKYRKVRRGVPQKEQTHMLSASVRKEQEHFTEMLGESPDIKQRIVNCNGRDVLLVFIDGMSDAELINEAVVKPLLFIGGDIGGMSVSEIKESVLAACDTEIVSSREECVKAVLSGDTAMIVDGCCEACVISSKGYEKRSIEKAENEISVRGPKESFTENLRTNTSLLRRIIRNGALTFENVTKGKQSNTALNIVYIKGIANEELIETVRKRVESINIDMILETGYVEQLIEDAPTSIFATVGHTEKPDVAAARLMEGRVIIIVDGAPFVLTAPHLLIEDFQAPEDYYAKPFFACVLRVLRMFAFMVSIFAPALFVALTAFHQELIPTSLLFTMAAARESVPFTAFSETVVMLLIFEVLREAGVRLPQAIGQTISIVGALVMGDAAVAAGIVGAPLVIVVAFTAVCSFAVPFLAEQQTMLRWLFLFMSGILGALGITFGAILLVIHIVSLRSFGHAYCAPLAPTVAADIKDSFVRMPLWLMRRRPKSMAKQNEVREDTPVWRQAQKEVDDL